MNKETTMTPFIFNGLPSRVIFGQGTISRLAEEVRALGCRRVLVLSTPEQESQGRQVLDQLGDLVPAFSPRRRCIRPWTLPTRRYPYSNH